MKSKLFNSIRCVILMIIMIIVIFLHLLQILARFVLECCRKPDEWLLNLANKIR